MNCIRNFIKDSRPDGVKAFITAICGCIFQACVLGISNSFPGMQGAILSDPKFSSTASEQLITLAFAFSTGLAPFFGIFSGLLTNKIGPRLTTFISVGACTTALLGTSYGAHDFGTIVGVYGVFMGITQGFALAPGATTVSTWFVHRKPVGMGILFASGGIGSLVVPPIVGVLLDHPGYDWRDTMRIICAFNGLAFLCCCMLTLRDDSKDSLQKKEEDEAEDVEGQTTVRGSPVGAPAVVEEEMHHVAEHITELHRQHPPTTAANNFEAKAAEAEAEAIVEEVIEKEWSLHEHTASPKQFVCRIIFTLNFIALFLAMGLFTIPFFGYIFMAVPYPLAMGQNGTKYADAKPINIKDASNLFIAYGAMTAFGGPGGGYVAHLTTDRYAYAAFMCILGITIGCTSLCREYYSFIIIMLIQGWCGGAFWGIFPSFVGRRFYGPNLGLTMGLVFLAGMAGGIGGPFAATDLVNGQPDKDRTPVLALFAVCAITSGLLILFTMEDRIGVPVLGEGERQKLAALKKREKEEEEANAANEPAAEA